MKKHEWGFLPVIIGAWLITVGLLTALLFLPSEKVCAADVIETVTNNTEVPLTTLRMTDAEFTALLIESLRNDINGKTLLDVSESIQAKAHLGYIELTAVVNLDKVEKASPEARSVIDKVDGFLFFVDRNRMSITIIGKPVVRNGLVGIRDDFSIELGPVPISNESLRLLGVDVVQANFINLQLHQIVAESVNTEQGSVILRAILSK